MANPTIPPTYDISDPSVELSSRRTGMSFQRTRMAADRTLMAIIRTALSLIGFGFTIFQVFKKMQEAKMMAPGEEPRNFGVALVMLGVLLLTMGIVYHLYYMYGLRSERATMVREGLIRGESAYPVSLTLITAVLLWLLGVMAISGMAFHLGSFG